MSSITWNGPLKTSDLSVPRATASGNDGTGPFVLRALVAVVNISWTWCFLNWLGSERSSFEPWPTGLDRCLDQAHDLRVRVRWNQVDLWML